VPDDISLETAAASLLQGLTALAFVRAAAGLPSPGPPLPRGTTDPGAFNRAFGPRPWALVHSAAGGTGSLLAAVLATHGARVIGTVVEQEGDGVGSGGGGGVGRTHKAAVARKHGAQWVVDRRREDVVARVREITGGKGVDVIFNGVGDETFEDDLKMAAKDGTVVVFGAAVSSSFHCPVWVGLWVGCS
jgi:NADPH2:quinone reductase